MFVLAAGVTWELLGFASGSLAVLLAVDAPLVVYGISDNATDVMFNTVVAVLVAALATDDLRGLVGFFGRRLRS